MTITLEVYRGRIIEGVYGDDYTALILSGHTQPLAEQIETDLELYGRYATVRYWVTDTERSCEQLDDNLAKVCVGAVDADYGSVYSETTGYLWTTAELMVGGHDLLAELESYVGRYVHLEIEYSDEPAGTGEPA